MRSGVDGDCILDRVDFVAKRVGLPLRMGGGGLVDLIDRKDIAYISMVATCLAAVQKTYGDMQLEEEPLIPALIAVKRAVAAIKRRYPMGLNDETTALHKKLAELSEIKELVKAPRSAGSRVLQEAVHRSNLCVMADMIPAGAPMVQRKRTTRAGSAAVVQEIDTITQIRRMQWLEGAGENSGAGAMGCYPGVRGIDDAMFETIMKMQGGFCHSTTDQPKYCGYCGAAINPDEYDHWLFCVQKDDMCTDTRASGATVASRKGYSW